MFRRGTSGFFEFSLLGWQQFLHASA